MSLQTIPILGRPVHCEFSGDTARMFLERMIEDAVEAGTTICSKPCDDGRNASLIYADEALIGFVHHDEGVFAFFSNPILGYRVVEVSREIV